MKEAPTPRSIKLRERIAKAGENALMDQTYEGNACYRIKAKMRMKHRISPLNSYKCVAYALGLSSYYPYVREVLHKRKMAAGLAFTNHLIQHFLHEIPSGEQKEQDIALYFASGICTHAGIVFEDGLILSKWGDMPPQVHPPFEVPTIYGDEIRFYRPMAPNVLFTILVDFHRKYLPGTDNE